MLDQTEADLSNYFLLRLPAESAITPNAGDNYVVPDLIELMIRKTARFGRGMVTLAVTPQAALRLEEVGLREMTVRGRSRLEESFEES